MPNESFPATLDDFYDRAVSAILGGHDEFVLCVFMNYARLYDRWRMNSRDLNSTIPRGIQAGRRCGYNIESVHNPWNQCYEYHFRRDRFVKEWPDVKAETEQLRTLSIDPEQPLIDVPKI